MTSWADLAISDSKAIEQIIDRERWISRIHREALEAAIVAFLERHDYRSGAAVTLREIVSRCVETYLEEDELHGRPPRVFGERFRRAMGWRVSDETMQRFADSAVEAAREVGEALKNAPTVPRRQASCVPGETQYANFNFDWDVTLQGADGPLLSRYGRPAAIVSAVSECSAIHKAVVDALRESKLEGDAYVAAYCRLRATAKAVRQP